jgi:hypothetical protein
MLKLHPAPGIAWASSEPVPDGVLYFSRRWNAEDVD